VGEKEATVKAREAGGITVNPKHIARHSRSGVCEEEPRILLDRRSFGRALPGFGYIPDDLGNVGFAHAKRTESELLCQRRRCGHLSCIHFEELDLTNRRASDIEIVGGKVTSL
jgi:hypothetical protein